ncbi:hypothetical protein [Wolbachia endosymbiont of Drosophila innubila]|nr:hypothetical protein [Wolbachia endosymbiont of Drosophila innubila]
MKKLRDCVEDPDILLALGKAKRNLGIATNGSNENSSLWRSYKVV